jgi:hypothetical protein
MALKRSIKIMSTPKNKIILYHGISHESPGSFNTLRHAADGSPEMPGAR